MGLALAVGGVWLIALGGSWYYVIAAVAFLLTGFLLFAARPAALLVYALLSAGTLIWSLWEVGLDWWPLAARGAVIFVVGLLLVTPWVTRALSREHSNSLAVRETRRVSALRGAGLPLTAALATALVVGIISWFNDPHQIEGTAPGVRAEAPADALGVPPGEWRAYGRTAQAQRYSPLDQITPANVVQTRCRLDLSYRRYSWPARRSGGDDLRGHAAEDRQPAVPLHPAPERHCARRHHRR